MEKQWNSSTLVRSSVHLFIHSFCSLPCDRSTASSSREFSIKCFPFQFTVSFFLRTSSSCLRLLPRLSITHILLSIFSSKTCFRKQFLRKLWPTQLATSLYIVCRIFLSILTLCNTFSFLLRSAQVIFSILHYNM